MTSVALRTVLLGFGTYITGSIGAIVTQGPQAVAEAEKRAFELGRALAGDILTKRQYPD